LPSSKLPTDAAQQRVTGLRDPAATALTAAIGLFIRDYHLAMTLAPVGLLQQVCVRRFDAREMKEFENSHGQSFLEV